MNKKPQKTRKLFLGKKLITSLAQITVGGQKTSGYLTCANTSMAYPTCRGFD
jgi:hypothetical protein